MKVVFILLIFNISFVIAQKNDKDFDYLNHPYKFLDKDFNIKINSVEFNKTLKEHQFIEEIINTYSDSLSVILMNEFGDWKKTRVAKLRITYKWERVGYHLWKNEDFVKKLAKRQEIKMPYELQEKFYNPKGNSEINLIVENLRKKLLESFNKDTLKTMSNKNLMKFAFNNNPEVLKLKEEFMKNRRN